MALQNVTYEMRMDVKETPDIAIATYPDPAVTHIISEGQKANSAADDLTLDGTTTPAITGVAGKEFTLTSGLLTIDLTAFDQGNLPDLDFSTKKGYMLKIAANGANTDTLRFITGASNGYDIFRSTGGDITLDKGEVAFFYFPEGLETIDATHKTIDVSSPDVDAKFTFLLITG